MRNNLYFGSIKNAAWIYFSKNRKDIENVRQQLFDNLSKYHPDIAKAVEKILENRIQSSPSPLIGELYPHMLNELVGGINPAVFKEISVQWLASYVLTVMIDNSYDKKEALDGSIIPALYAESAKLYSHVTSNGYLKLFEEMVFDATKGQIQDMLLQKKNEPCSEKLQSAKDKNKILSALAVVFSYYLDSPKHVDSIMSFTDNFLLGFQMLDDIADFETDYLHGNKTYLLSGVEIEGEFSRRKLLKELIFSDTFDSILVMVEKSLANGKQIIEDDFALTVNQLTYKYIAKLHKEVCSLRKLLGQYIHEDHMGTPVSRETILDKIEEKVAMIAGSS